MMNVIIENAGIIGLGLCVILFLVGCIVREDTLQLSVSDHKGIYKILRFAQKFWWASLACLVIGILVQAVFS